jgi:asparaginyl-tRNA synthetase
VTTPPILPDVHQHLRDPGTRNVLRIQHETLGAVREYLSGEGFLEMLPPVIGPVTDPGIRGSKQVDVDYYGHRYRLMTSAILYKQASLLAADRIFCIAPNVRLEPPETAGTGRHLVEFHQIDVELAHADRDQAMAVAEGLLRSVVDRVRERCSAELEAMGRDSGAFADLLANEFPRESHAEAVGQLIESGYPQSPDAEIAWPAEVVLSRKASRPFFLTDYPKGCRGFYDQEDPDRPGVLRSFDLIAPEGYGELCSGGQRESDYRRVVVRMRETGENPAKYGWYLQMLKEGVPSSAGFGIGLQRLVRYLAGLDSVWQASAFPKLAGIVSP